MPDDTTVRAPALDQVDPSFEQRVKQRTSELSHALALVEAQKRDLELALRERGSMQAELEDAQLLQSMSAMLVDEDNIGALYQKLVDVGTRLMRSDFGSMQRYDEERGELQLIAQVGLDAEAVDFWQWVHPGRATTCGRALETGQRVLVSDFTTCDFIVGTEDAAAFERAGVRSAMSTPLLTRNGKLVGMITAHWTRNYEPRERDMRLLDIVARQAADLIERAQSAQALRIQAERLLEADRYKDQFLATLAHELRNPLAPIRTGVAVLKIGKPEQVPRVLDMMDRQLSHMVRLIDDLLDVSRISRGMVTLKRARTELNTVIDSAIETSRPLINAAHHAFTVTRPGNSVWLDVDVTRVAQVISNLLNNAAKYTPPGGQIDLIAEVVKGEVSIRVVDNGIGIPASMLPKIFDLFTQVDGAAERSQGGLGVGLALARQLAEMHAGRIEVDSRPEQPGSTFTVKLPLAEPVVAPTLDGLKHAQAAATHPPVRVLIVDENADAADTLALLLDELGHVTCVELDSTRARAIALVELDSTRAMARALSFAPDVMLLDLSMPYLSGFDLARQMRADPALRHVHLAALSGWATDEDRGKSQDAGIDHHLNKPVMLDDVELFLAKVVARNRLV